MMKKNKCLSNQKGSTSVLIIILMIVLMAFGMAALTTSYAGYRLASKNVEFNRKSYELEASALQTKYDILKLIVTTSEDMKQEKEDNSNSEIYYEMLFDELNIRLIDYIESHQDQISESAYERDEFSQQIKGSGKIRLGTFKYTVSSQDEEAKHLSVKLDLFEPTSEEVPSLDTLVTTLEWYEWQEGIGEVNEDIFFDDPFEENDFESFDEDPIELFEEEPSDNN